jgi:hypothetical protein
MAGGRLEDLGLGGLVFDKVGPDDVALGDVGLDDVALRGGGCEASNAQLVGLVRHHGPLNSNKCCRGIQAEFVTQMTAV